ncbi:MAG: type II toxin-antitoxin system RatA family toxin [Proteobacteria bacterium]|nr:type II toxin-antitoxin system RatA family toxin [Pseudomonadota bacterium]
MTTTIERSALVAHSAETMFDLVDAAERYPERFGWCQAADVERMDGRYVARLDVGLGRFKTWFKTENTSERPLRIDMRLVDGPFKSLEGHWRFTALDPHACKVALELKFEPASSLLGPVLALGLQNLADRMVDDFIRVANRAGLP